MRAAPTGRLVARSSPSTVAHRHLEASAAEVEPDDRSGARPHARLLSYEAEPSLFGTVENLYGEPDCALESANDLGTVGRLAKCCGPESDHDVDVERVERMAKAL